MKIDELSGDISCLRGKISPKFSGDITDCCLTDAERQKGVNIKDLFFYNWHIAHIRE